MLPGKALRDRLERHGAALVSHPFAVALAIFAMAFAIRLALLWISGAGGAALYFEIVNIGQSLAETGRFADAYGPGSGPTAHTTPLYPLFVAGVFSIFGSGHQGFLAVRCLTAFMASLTWALLPLLAPKLGIRFATAAMAGLLGAVVVITPGVEIDGKFEAVPAGLLLLLWSCLALPWAMGNSVRPLRAALIGALGAAASLTSAVLAAVVMAVGAIGLLYARSRAPYMKSAAISAAVLCLCLSPWVLRNWLVLGSPVALRSNFGLELRVSNNPLARPTVDQQIDIGIYRKYHPRENAAERRRWRQIGEIAYQREKFAEAMQWITGNRSRFLDLCAGRIKAFWLLPSARPILSIVSNGITLLAALGLILGWRDRPRLFGLLAAILMAYSLPWVLLQVAPRYRYPLHWILFVLAAVAAVRVLEWLWAMAAPAACPRGEELAAAHESTVSSGKWR